MSVWCVNFKPFASSSSGINVTVKIQVSRSSSNVRGSPDHSSRGGAGLSCEISDPSRLSAAPPARPNLGCWQFSADVHGWLHVFSILFLCLSMATAAWMPRNFWSKSDINSLHSSLKTKSSIHCARTDCGREILKRDQPVADGSSSSRTTWYCKQMSKV